MVKNSMVDIYLAGVMGVVVGDALGCPVQFKSRAGVDKNPITGMRGNGTFNLPAGSWTDDSSLTLAMLASIKDKGTIDANDIMCRFADWLDKGDFTPYGYAFDIGFTCEKSIENYKISKDISTCGLSGGHDNGNGSLMRTIPACIFVYEQVKAGKITEDEGVNLIHTVSALTHAHRRSQMACGIYYFMVKHILDDRESKSLSECIAGGVDEGIKFYGKDLKNLTETAYFGRLFNMDQLRETARNAISSSGYVISTLEAAVWSLVTTDSFESALLKAVNLADDSDTVGAVAGGLAGLYYGYDAIPKDWLAVIKRRDWIEDLCRS